MKKILLSFAVLMVILTAGPILALATGQAALETNWRTANRDSVSLAPDAAFYEDAVVQVYGARAVNWRGIFGVHTWIAVKQHAAPAYEVFEVLGWRGRGGGSVVSVGSRVPDGRWFGSEPDLLFDARGDVAAAMIDPIREAVRDYPFSQRYEVWPGPNSNTFVAHVARQVPGLNVAFPVTAIGKDYLPGAFFARATSDSGYQLSLKGLLGVIVSLEEGLEFNILGLSFGIDFMNPAIKLPGIARIGTDA
jgi:hypothetical protein